MTESRASDLLLIQPPAYGEFSPPLGLATLLSWLRSHEVKVHALDYNIDFFNHVPGEIKRAWRFSEALTSWNDPAAYDSTVRPLFKSYARRIGRDILLHNPTYVGLSVLETGAQATADLIGVIRELFGQEVRILVGGPDIGREQAREYLLKHGVYCAFHGEAEVGLLKLLRQTREEGGPRLREIPGIYYLEDGRMAETAPELVKDLDSMPFPDFSDFDLGAYAFREKLLPITTSRGCVAKCSFCGETNFMNRFRQLSAPRIVSEIENGISRYGVKIFRLNDSLINGNAKVLEAWIDALLAKEIQIVFGAAQARISDRMTDALLAKMKKAGCYLLQYGVETGSDRLLKIMKKGITAKQAIDVVRRTKKAGILVQINLIVGHFEETWADFFRTLLFVFRLRGVLDVVAVNPYNFDRFSHDSKTVKGITNMTSERWTNGKWQHTYAVRRLKCAVLLALMGLFGIRRP